MEYTCSLLTDSSVTLFMCPSIIFFVPQKIMEIILYTICLLTIYSKYLRINLYARNNSVWILSEVRNSYRGSLRLNCGQQERLAYFIVTNEIHRCQIRSAMLELFSESDYCFSSYTWYQTVSTLTKNKYAPSGNLRLNAHGNDSLTTLINWVVTCY